MPENPQNTISQTALKYLNQFRSLRTQDIIWLQIIKYTKKKPKVETTVKERYQQQLDCITIYVLNI